jgi:hypothetical protein
MLCPLPRVEVELTQRKGGTMAKKTAGRKAAKAAATKPRAARKAARAADSDERSDYRQKVRDQKLEEADKKGGCAPKLFVLLLPLIGLGTYLLLRA